MRHDDAMPAIAAMIAYAIASFNDAAAPMAVRAYFRLFSGAGYRPLDAGT